MSCGVELPAAGEVLATHAKNLFGELSAIEQEVRSSGTDSTRLRIEVFATAGVELLPPVVKAFREQHPGVRLRLSATHGDDAVSRLREGAAHVVLVWGYDVAPQAVDRGLYHVTLPDDPLHVVLPLDHPLVDADEVALADLSGEQWVTRAHRAPYETMCRLAGFEPQITFRAADYHSRQGLVAAGMGVSLLPRLSPAAHRTDLADRPLAGRGFARRVTAVTLPEARRSKPVADFQEVLRSSAGAA
ncbi:LysR substrate-binding domain-containing protein [Amycolatopsis sp. NPDC023774]|uniref:LysR substrate-binding domain-containing protein n=1 Tax=Amycolatopsis sp. NPDC023774 TaxID=3155015 RepID=UPI0033C8526A